MFRLATTGSTILRRSSGGVLATLAINFSNACRPPVASVFDFLHQHDYAYFTRLSTIICCSTLDAGDTYPLT